MLTEEQLENRRKGIGGSDVAALMGADPYKQAIDIFYDKRPDLAEEHGYVAPQVEGIAADRGNLFEEPVAKLYEMVSGNKVRRSMVHHQHPKHPWLMANIDRKIEGSKTGLEIKTVTHHLAHLWGPSGTDEVAPYYIWQPHHYMLVLDYPQWELAAMIGMDDLRRYDIVRDPEMDELIVEVTHDFWHENVLKGVPPEIDLEHQRASDVLKRVYSKVSSEEVQLDDSFAHWFTVMEQAKQRARDYESVAKGAKLHLLEAAGNAGTVRIDGVPGGFTRKVVKRKEHIVAASEYIDFRYGKNK